jgi:hypothetical protein
MPFEVDYSRWRTPGLRASESPPCKSDQPVAGALGITEVLRYQEAVVIGEAQGSSIERLVVVGAQSEAVVFGIGPSMAVPSDMSSLDAEVGGAEQCVVATHRATVFVDAENGFAECGVARTAACDLDERHPNGIQNVAVERSLPVVFEEAGYDVVHQIRADSKAVVEIGGQAALGLGAQEHRFWRVVLPGPLIQISFQVVDLRDIPQAIRPEMPKRVLRVKALARGAEIHEQFPEWSVEVFE